MKKTVFLFISLFTAMLANAQLRLSLTVENWVNGAWQNSFLDVNEYNDNQHLIGNVYSSWNTSGSNWDEVVITENSVNAAGMVDTSILRVYSIATSTWNLSTRYVNTYSPSGKLIENTTEGYSTGSWQYETRTQFTYDANDNQIVLSYDLYDAPSSMFQPFYRSTNTIDLDGRVATTLAEYYNSDLQIWDVSTRSTNSYNANGKIAQIIHEGFTAGNWVNSGRYTFTYDASGYLVVEQRELWNANASTWRNNGQIDYTNFPSGDVQQYISQAWDINTNTWVNAQRANYTYLEFSPSVIQKQQDAGVLVYPNPVKNAIQFSLKGNTLVSIYNSQGKFIKMQQLNAYDSKIDVSELSNGLYTVHFDSQGTQSVSKFIKVD